MLPHPSRFFTIICSLFLGATVLTAAPATKKKASASEDNVPTAKPVTETSPSALKRQAGANGVSAIVNGKVITQAEVAEAARFNFISLNRGVTDPKSREEKMEEAKQKTLQDLIDREVIISEFDKNGGKIKPHYIDEDIQRLIRENFKGNRENFNQELSRMNLTWVKFREMHEKKLVISAMRQQATQTVGYPTPDQKEAFLKKNPDLFREDGEIWIKTIAMPTLTGEAGVSGDKQREQQMKLTKEIRRRLVSGADFAAEARAYSEDSHKAEGGDWGWVKKSDLADQLADTAFKTGNKQLSDVFEFRGYYYLLYVMDKKLGAMKPQKEIEDMLEKMVILDQRKKASEEWIVKLRQRAVIQIF